MSWSSATPAEINCMGMDYGAAAARYVDVFMEAIRWDNAVKLYDRYSRDT